MANENTPLRHLDGNRTSYEHILTLPFTLVDSLQLTRPVFFKTLSPLNDQSGPQTETGIKRTNWANKRGKSTSNPTYVAINTPSSPDT